MKIKTKKPSLSLQMIQSEWEDCKKCTIGSDAKNHVFWDFLPDSINTYPHLTDLPQIDIVMIGEGPGQVEDNVGTPFTGPAGQLLRRALKESGLTDKYSVALMNLVLCRPYATTKYASGNRPPTFKEVDNCLPRLIKSIAALNPSWVVFLGRGSAEWRREILGDLEDQYGIRVLEDTKMHPAHVLRHGLGDIKYVEYVQDFKYLLMNIEQEEKWQ